MKRKRAGKKQVKVDMYNLWKPSNDKPAHTNHTDRQPASHTHTRRRVPESCWPIMVFSEEDADECSWIISRKRIKAPIKKWPHYITGNHTYLRIKKTHNLYQVVIYFVNSIQNAKKKKTVHNAMGSKTRCRKSIWVCPGSVTHTSLEPGRPVSVHFFCMFLTDTLTCWLTVNCTSLGSQFVFDVFWWQRSSSASSCQAPESRGSRVIRCRPHDVARVKQTCRS